MNSAAVQPVRWPRRRWVYAIAGVFTLQAALAYYLGQKERRLPERPAFRTAIHMAADAESTRRLAALTTANDPTLLALPSLGGFSGPAWLKFPVLEYQPAEWAEPPHWLPADARSLGASFSGFVRTNVVRPLLITDKPLPSPTGYDPSFPNDPLPAQSRLRVEGILAGRTLLTRPALPSWPAAEMISNSVVQVAVDADGFIFSPVLLAGSGSTNADAHALAVAIEARFRPLPRHRRIDSPAGAFTWGRLVFQWHTLPLPATNVVVVPLP